MPAMTPAQRAITVLAAAFLAACGTASHGAVSAPHTSAPHTSAALSCHQQYETWKHGAVRGAASRLETALRRVQAQGAVDDLPRMVSALRSAGRAAQEVAAVPPPRCADPAGDYGKMLTLIQAAGDNARSASGLGGILLAEVPLKNIPAVEKQLGAELDRTVGKSH
ncbi:MAG TPA: hypothetical protein VGS19_29090 [Streptosporangiaceae bacterium]|nr:hypothetical protein [Streptosporangiaceae bacterium]